MKLYTYLLFLFLTFTACSQNVGKESFADIKTSKTKDHTRIKGSRVFMKIPPGYSYIRELSRYQKSDDCHIQIVEAGGVSYNAAKDNFTMEAFASKGAPVDVLNKIKLNEYEAVYIDGPSKKAGEIKTMLAFGDDSVVVMIVGVYKSSNKQDENEIKTIFRSIYYDRTFKLDLLELANFEFDLSITGFEYQATASNFITYGDDKNDSLGATMQIGNMPAMTKFKAKAFAKDLIWRYEFNGVTLENKEIIETQINNYTAYVLESKVKSKNSDGIMYQVVLVGDNSCVISISAAYKNRDEFLAKFKKTAETIKIK